LSSEVHTDTLDMKNKGKIETGVTVTETWPARHEMTIGALEIHATVNYARMIDVASSDLRNHNPTVPDNKWAIKWLGLVEQLPSIMQIK